MDDELVAFGKYARLQTRGRITGLQRIATIGFVEEPDGYRVFDYLLDYVERDARFLFPPQLLERLRKVVTPAESHRVALALTDAYRLTGQDAARV